MQGVRIIFPAMYALYGNIKAYYCIIMHNYSLNMKNCLNYANYAVKRKLDLFWYFIKISIKVCDNISRLYDVMDLVLKKHIPH